ncbi:MAG: sigma-70 family RNA polymerase sigma factor [Gammaproteobacteria bacterium]|nr:sigma-70 family RNA polymerase sigma factor [Gammaproteobacteria bacterium]
MHRRTSTGHQGTPEQSAFETLVRPHLKPLFRLAYRLTHSREEAEDLIQELLLKLYPRRHELMEVDRLRPWLARVMYRIFIDNRRRYSRSPVHLAVDCGTDAQGADPIENLAGAGDNPELETEQNVLTRHLLQVIDRLSEDHRHVLGLHDIEGYTLEEMQVILDCPIGTLKSRLHRARARLRELLSHLEMDFQPPVKKINRK